MSKTQQKKYKVKDKNKKKVLYWDDITKLNIDAKEIVKSTGVQLQQLVEKYKDVIDTNKDLGDQILGTAAIIKYVSGEIKKLEETHTDKETKELYKGKVKEDTKEIDLYITILMGYENLIAKLSNELDNILVTFSGELAEKAKKQSKVKPMAKGAKNGK